MNEIRSTGPLIALGAGLVAACTGTPVSTGRQEVATVPRATFYHAGFGAGPVVFTNAAGQLVEERRIEPFGAPIGVPDVAARNRRMGGCGSLTTAACVDRYEARRLEAIEQERHSYEMRMFSKGCAFSGDPSACEQRYEAVEGMAKMMGMKK